MLLDPLDVDGDAAAGLLEDSVVGLGDSPDAFSAPSALPFVVASAGFDSDGVERLSVLYHPEPLKMIPAGDSSFFNAPWQLGHTVMGESLMLWKNSKRCPQLEH